jgi:hypothetical protein
LPEVELKDLGLPGEGRLGIDPEPDLIPLLEPEVYVRLPPVDELRLALLLAPPLLEVLVRALLPELEPRELVEEPELREEEEE